MSITIMIIVRYNIIIIFRRNQYVYYNLQALYVLRITLNYKIQSIYVYMVDNS